MGKKVAKEKKGRKPTDKVRKQALEAAAESEANDDPDDIPLTHKYRPRKLSDFAGQDQVVEVLEDIFTTGKIPRAFLIEGQTGSGKTTAARWISMRVNCEKPKGVNPCGKCGSCKRYLTYPAPAHPAHIEINASSQNSINDVRELVRKSKYNLMVGNYRVILLDEPQGLSHSAKEALLKPIEDPAKDTIWILSTTDPGKLPSTLIGRCRAGHLRIRPPSTKALAQRLQYIAKKEGVTTIPKKWLKKISVASNHQPRDAVAVLEQVLNAMQRRKGKKVDLEKILPRIVDEVQSGNPDRVAMEIAAGVLGDQVSQAQELAKRSGIEAHVLLGALIRVWNQTLLSATSMRLVEPYYARSMFRVYKDYGVDVNGDDLTALVRSGEYLARQYERAKAFIVDGNFLITLTIAGMWEMCAEIYGTEEEDDDE